jgi:flagellar protein FlbT
MIVSLRASEKLYINGAVITVDRKVNIELLNDVTFLLDSHVLRPADANTPLKQLYFVVQTALMDPAAIDSISPMIDDMLERTMASFENSVVLTGLRCVHDQVSRSRYFEAMRTIRSLYATEAEIMSAAAGTSERSA